MEADLDLSGGFDDVDEFDVAAVGLDGGADEVDDGLDLGVERGCCGGGGGRHVGA